MSLLPEELSEELCAGLPGQTTPINVPEKPVLYLLAWPRWGWGPRVGV